MPETEYELLIIGAGPAGLSALRAAKEAGLSAAAIDKGPAAGALARHPVYMRWFSTADKLELGGFPLLCEEKNPTRREYLRYLRTFVRYFDLEIIPYCEVTGISPARDAFLLAGRDIHGRPKAWRSRYLIAATGFYDSPRMLAVPGEDLEKVTHRYSEAHFYAGFRVLVVGAGSSAAECALELYRAGAEVTVAMREQAFQTKYWIEPDIENRIEEGRIHCHRGVRIKEILPAEVILEKRDGSGILTVPNDFVLAMTGYEPDTSLIEAAGADVSRESGKPVISDDFESTVPGLYIAGTLCAGKEANVVFVENGREHGPAIVRHILARAGN
jgi:thioredoxin reductase (NADPH)